MEVADAKDAGATLGVSARELVAMVVGLSFLWPYPLARSDTFFPLSFVFDGAAEFESHSVVLCQMAFSGFLILASVLIIMGRKRLQEVMTARWRLCAVFVAVAGFGSTVGLLAVDVAGPMRLPLALCMLLVCALWIAICVVMWGEALSRVGGAVSLLIVCVSFLLCQCVYLVLTLAALPMGPYLALCPAVMGAALAMQTCRRAGPLSFELVSVRDLPVSLFLSSLVVVICSVLGAQLLPGADANQMSAASRVVTFVTSMVVIGAIAGWCLVRGWSRGFVIEAYAILTILIVAGFVVVIVAQTMGLDFSQRRVVVTVAQCFGAYLFAVLADICLTRRIGSTLLFGALTVAIIGIPRLSSSMLDLVLSGSPVVASVPIETTAAILALLVVVLAYVPIVRLAVTHALAAENTRAAGGDAAARCEKAARVAGLSVRESEALLCLYEGMSAKQLAQSMVIAESTAKTYAKHVFAKAGVHSRDELAQFVDSL